MIIVYRMLLYCNSCSNHSILLICSLTLYRYKYVGPFSCRKLLLLSGFNNQWNKTNKNKKWTSKEKSTRKKLLVNIRNSFWLNYWLYLYWALCFVFFLLSVLAGVCLYWLCMNCLMKYACLSALWGLIRSLCPLSLFCELQRPFITIYGDKVLYEN